MNQKLLFLLDNDQNFVASAIRSFFAGIIKFLYRWIGYLVNAMYSFASKDYLGLGTYVENFAEKIFFALIIFMIFKVTLAFFTYLVNPDSFNDDKKGVAGIIKRIIIALTLLVSINPIFNILYDAQDKIIKSGFIENTVLGSKNEYTYRTTNGDSIYFTQISDKCDELAPGMRTITFSSGEHLALLTLKPFIQPSDDADAEEQSEILNEKNYCGVEVKEYNYIDTDEFTRRISICKQALGNNANLFNLANCPVSTSYYLEKGLINSYTGKSTFFNGIGDALGVGEDDIYVIDFNYFFALIVGIVECLILISFCFDIVIRAFTLLILQVAAPIPIISYISPGSKSSDMLSIWGKKLMSTWASLFIKILALTLGTSIISAVCESNTFSNSGSGLLMQIIVILGALMFAKKLPQLIEELFPGLKMDPLKLNPFKRVREDALGGDMIMNAAGRTVGAVSGGLGGLAAGVKAGREVGNVGAGALLGAFSGIGTGISKKKMAFGDGMNSTYKNLTGNEMNRLTMTGLMLSNSKKGQNKMDEIKGTLDTAYDKMNTLRTRLNASEHSSAQLASSLSSRGYDVTSFDGMRTDVNNRIGLANARLQGLENNRLNLDNDQQNAINAYNAASANYSDAENTYNGTQGVYQNAETMYNNAVANHRRVKAEHDDIEQRIADLKKQISSSTSIGSFNNKLYDDMSRLEKQKANLERYMTAAEGTISARERDLNNARSSVENARTNMDNLREIMVNAETNMNTAVDNYNNIVNEINQVNNEIVSYNNDLESINRYENQGRFENEIRADISKLDKAINVISAEKSQVENFYRQDKAPTADYKDKVDVVNSLDVNRSINDI